VKPAEGGLSNAASSCITATEAVSTSIKYTGRLAEAGIEPSVGSVGDSYDSARWSTKRYLNMQLLRQRNALIA
jgi:hypothetical protein